MSWFTSRKDDICGQAFLSRFFAILLSFAMLGFLGFRGGALVKAEGISGGLTSDQEQAFLKAKTVLATDFYQALLGQLSYSTYKQEERSFFAEFGLASPQLVVPDACDPSPCLPASDTLSVPQYAQTKSYYCGPATAKEILAYKGYSKTQDDLANDYLNTDTSGTGWANGTGVSPSSYAPMPYTLNTIDTHSWVYVGVGGSGVSGGSTITTSQWEQDLTTDIYLGWPIAGNVVEQPNKAHLTGHPKGQLIYHWIAIKGYGSSGASTIYVDSVYGASSISWSSSVTSPSSSVSSSDMAFMLDGRGYVW